MSDLVKFLRDRLDEDECTAAAVQNACRDTREPWPPEQAPGRGGPALTAYLKHFPEYRMIREVQAKRLLLQDHEGVHRCDWGEHHGPGFGYCKTVLTFAAIYTDHPDYDEARR